MENSRKDQDNNRPLLYKKSPTKNRYNRPIVLKAVSFNVFKGPGAKLEA